MRHWRSPCDGVRDPGQDVRRRGSPREEPDTDGLACPFCSDDAASCGIEARAIGACILALDVAANVGVLARSEDVAVVGREGA